MEVAEAGATAAEVVVAEAGAAAGEVEVAEAGATAAEVEVAGARPSEEGPAVSERPRRRGSSKKSTSHDSMDEPTLQWL